MREKHVCYAKRIALLVACGAISTLVMGLFGCTNDNPSHSNQNGISAPAPEPEGANYTVSTDHNSLIIGGSNSGSGLPTCGIDVLVLGGDNEPQIDAPCELYWNASAYPNRGICIAGSGTTYSFSDGVWHVYATTDAYGVARFRVGGFYSGTISCGGGEGSTSTPRSVTLIVEGVTVTSSLCNVTTADYNGSNGVNSTDITKFNIDDACANYYSRSDFDGDGDVDSADSAIINAIVNGGQSNASFCE